MSRITINSNILSLSAQRRFTDHTRDLQSSFTRLSSGLRINKAGDDAAGLAISENLKTDTRLANQAIRNVNDGISMVSIISGALDSQKQILFRMAELAEQSANGTNSLTQRKSLQQEYMSLQEEFDRVATSAEFNGIKLLRNSNPSQIKIMAGLTGADSSLLTVTAANSHRFSGQVAMKSDWDNDGFVSSADIAQGRDSLKFISPLSDSAVNSLDYFQNFAQVSSKDSNGNDILIRFRIDRQRADFFAFLASPDPAVYSDPANFNIIAYAQDSSGEQAGLITNISTALDTPANLTFSFVGSGATANYQVDVSGFDPEYYGWGSVDNSIKDTAIGMTNILSKRTSLNSLETAKNRIDILSKLQGSFGALESRLQVSANKLAVDKENFQSASSQITDVDVAFEAANLTKSQILQQASSSVLAQANQQPQIALSLLGGL